MDALSDVLRVSHLTSGVFLQAEFTAPWCLRSKIAPDHCSPALGPAAHLVPYHYVVDGSFQLRVGEGDAGEVLTIEAGDVVMLPGNDLHFMGSDLTVPPVSGRDIVRVPGPGELRSMRHGGGGARTYIMCGFLGCEAPDTNPVLAALPPVLKLTPDASAGADWIRATFRFAAEEVAAGRPGSETVLEKVSELLFVEAVRRYVESLPDAHTGWLAGLRDQHVARALALIHRDLARPWTVDDLGREVGLSRSALADRFMRRLAIPPIQYLARRRMEVAMQKLRHTNASLAQIAETIGYESEAAFSRAFKRAMGSAPGTWRRAHDRPV